jgi:pyruvate dehydrogenase E2 component (dihydrolipoamide acetyltransferase)
LSPIRKVIAQRLAEAKNSIPHFYIQQTIDAEGLVSLRSHLKEEGVNVTFNDLIIKAVALALKKHPTVNSGFDPKTFSIMRFKTIDISVAVSIEEGLITPIVKNADVKTLKEISAEVKQLSAKAKEGKLQPNEFQGGGFTISNLGMYGVTNFSAIINPPQAAILAVSGIVDSPVVKNGQVVAGKTMNLNLSVDHRVIDGVAGAEFIKTLQRYLEKPLTILLN